MKKFFLLSTVVLVAFIAEAQSYESIKTKLTLRQYPAAKTDLDKAWANAKFTSKAEAYMLKASIYGAMANDASVKGTPAADQYNTEADAAFAKYKEMDPALSLVSDPVYQDAPVNIYAYYYTSGYKDYEAKNWQVSLQKLKKAVEYSDFIISKKIGGLTADTNSLILAAVTAENADMKDEAAKYYVRLADMNLSGKDFLSLYRFLVRYYADKKDDANFEKYKALGKQYYPDDPFFTYDKVDFALGSETDFNKRIKALEETVAKDPNNWKAVEFLAELIYDTLYSNKEGAVPPANAAELEPKMISGFTKAAALHPDDELPWVFIAQSHINKRDKINEAREKHVADMKTRTKPGTQPSKDDIAKRDALDAQFSAAFLAAEDPFKKAVDILSKKPVPLSGQDIQRYKNVAGFLGDIATHKKTKVKAGTPDFAKYTAEEKKWNDLYDEVSKMKPKPKDN